MLFGSYFCWQCKRYLEGNFQMQLTFLYLGCQNIVCFIITRGHLKLNKCIVYWLLFRKFICSLFEHTSWSNFFTFSIHSETIEPILTSLSTKIQIQGLKILEFRNWKSNLSAFCNAFGNVSNESNVSNVMKNVISNVILGMSTINI